MKKSLITVFSSDISECPASQREILEGFVEQMLLLIGEYEQIYGEERSKALLIKAQHLLFTIGMLIREVWDPKYNPVGMPKRAYPAYKPLGELYERFLSLAERLKTFEELAPIPLPVGSPLEWTLSAMICGDFELLDAGSKRESIVKIKRFSATLKQLENPLDQGESPVPFTILQVAIAIAAQNDNFRKKYWNPFTKSYSNWRTEYESDRWRPAQILEDGKVKYSPKGNRRGLISI